MTSDQLDNEGNMCNYLGVPVLAYICEVNKIQRTWPKLLMCNLHSDHPD